MLEMTVEKTNECYKGAYLNAKVSFSFDDVVLDEDLLEELCNYVAFTWNSDDIYNFHLGENAIYLEIDKDWWDETYDAEQKASVENEMLSDAENVFVRQIIRDKGIYLKYQSIFEDFLVKNRDERMFDKSYIAEAADNFEQMFENMNLQEINNISEKDLKEEILNDIKENYSN